MMDHPFPSVRPRRLLWTRPGVLLFAAGFFFGGVVDHVIFALRGEVAPYGVWLGLTGNWLMAIFDALMTGVLAVLAHRSFSRLER